MIVGVFHIEVIFSGVAQKVAAPLAIGEFLAWHDVIAGTVVKVDSLRITRLALALGSALHSVRRPGEQNPSKILLKFPPRPGNAAETAVGEILCKFYNILCIFNVLGSFPNVDRM